ncbi:chromate transporter [Dorea sp. D27]|uniref:chromate transporter n=1 Tax=Dorea sp. D27 TaxID=658665 RepID=UPI0006739C1B|nr:chromate transporter [Dorea sp. D27]KMZ52795.1 chromate transport protein [Dorea sp. D27]
MTDKQITGPVESLSSLYIYRKLFFTNLIISACTFGGGFVIITMMRKKFVEELHWLTEDEMLDMTAIAQSAPGALAVNASIVVGYRMKRFAGALVCTVATIIPPLVIISVIALFYNQFRDNSYIAVALQVMRAGVAAVIFDVVISLAGNVIKTKSILWMGLMAAAFIASYFFKVSAVIIILLCGAVGLIQVCLSNRHDSPTTKKGGGQ